MRKEFVKLADLDRERTRLLHIAEALGWDQETCMPEKAVAERSEQIALIEGLAHDRAVSPAVGELISALEALKDLDPLESAYLKVARREYDREAKLPADLVMEEARAASVSQAAWAKAREDDDFPAFAPHLARMVDLAKRKAACLNPHARPYDVLLDLFEPGSTEASVGGIFTVMRRDLARILDLIRSRPQVDDSFLHRPLPDAAQRAISDLLMEGIGYDLSRGRLDTTDHPFTSRLGQDDVRITTRFLPDYFPSGIFSTIHETGHAMYELGIDPGPGWEGTRLAEAASMAVHESQSRLLENVIGRSEAFWRTRYAKLAALASPVLDGIGLERFVKAANRVEPSPVRVEADEVTYGLHIILRFGMESALVSGSLSVEDVPAEWKRMTRELLGLDIADDRSGSLQDIHWSMGAFGYFPSYALGNLYAAQFWDAMRKDVPDMESRIAAGDLGPYFSWLGERVHAPGSTWEPGELLRRATGESLDPSHFTRYLESKYGAVYGF